MEVKEFEAIRISLASPEEIATWSHGEVTKPETINYRRLRPEKDGLFCEAIFGPTRDWQCYCGKYKKIRYRGIVCDKCGVEVTRSRVRRERMGHIDLASPVAHIWYTRRVPSYVGLLLDISRRNLDRILYFAQYVITSVNEEERLRVIKRLDEEARERVQELNRSLSDSEAALLAEAEESVAAERSALETKRTRLTQQMEESISELTDAAAKLQKELASKRDKSIRKPVTFAATGDTIAEAGETVSQMHFERLSEIVGNRISHLQYELEEAVRPEAEALDEAHRRALSQAHKRLDEQRREIENAIAEHEERTQSTRDSLAGLVPGRLLSEQEYYDLREHWGNVFEANMGAEALYDILRGMDLDEMAVALRNEIRSGRSKQRRRKAAKQLKVVEALRRSNNRPEWMILKVLPVIPPDLRPMVQLDGGRFATSDLNDLYRRVINRNNRLKRLLDLGAPDVIIRNEKRMLQEAVDSLIDNSRRGKATSPRGRRKLKSLSDMLKGKQGRFRRNLLGKRVDYSGRSVIVVGPHLKLHQCGLPKGMALELFRPFVMRKLVEYNYAHNVKSAKRQIEKMEPLVWEVLDEIIHDYPILLNRAPTLHRLGIQAFEPVLVEGNAIQIHPLVCGAFNADFDGDMMAVHVPLSERAKAEARELMLASKNLLKPASGEPIVEPTKDMILGCHYLTLERDEVTGTGKVFSDLDEVALALELGHLHLHAPIKVWAHTHYDVQGQRYEDGRSQRRLINTTVGRALFNRVLPDVMRYYEPRAPLDKRDMKLLLSTAYRWLGLERTAVLVDQIKELGFHFASRSGISIGVHDIVIPARKADVITSADSAAVELNRQYRRGLITDDERYTKTIDVWTHATDELTDAVRAELPRYGPLRLMTDSGSTKGGYSTLRQLSGMRGLMGDPSGRIIDLPIRSNFREGLTALEFFISTHGARKGLADTALRTADAGYLTRRLVDIAQDIIVNAHDCETRDGVDVSLQVEPGTGEHPRERLYGRVTQGPVVDTDTGEIVVEDGTMLEQEQLDRIFAATVSAVRVRSPMTCQLTRGICQLCYGVDLGRGGLARLGEAVGIIAAQSIGEPGTQLTLRTFHTGGVATAGGGDITHGLPRVQELFEARNPKGEAVMADFDGKVEEFEDEHGVTCLRLLDSRAVADEYPLDGASAAVNDGEPVEAGTMLAGQGETAILATQGGIVELADGVVKVHRSEIMEETYQVPVGTRLRVRHGQAVRAGDQLTDGALNPHRILQILGRDATREYLRSEIQKVYRSQGVTINDKHIEIIIRQMLSKVRIRRAGDTDLLPGDLVDRLHIELVNERVLERAGRPATYQEMLLGITKASLETDSFLSAASFQHTINVLARAAIEGKVDRLFGLKENVIIGKLIPAGTGFRPRADTSLPGDELAELLSVGRAEEFDVELEEEEFDDLVFDDEELTELEFDEDELELELEEDDQEEEEDEEAEVEEGEGIEEEGEYVEDAEEATVGFELDEVSLEEAEDIGFEDVELELEALEEDGLGDEDDDLDPPHESVHGD